MKDLVELYHRKQEEIKCASKGFSPIAFKVAKDLVRYFLRERIEEGEEPNVVVDIGLGIIGRKILALNDSGTPGYVHPSVAAATAEEHFGSDGFKELLRQLSEDFSQNEYVRHSEAYILDGSCGAIEIHLDV